MIILRQKEYTSIGRKLNAKVARLRVNAAQKMGDYMIDKAEESTMNGANLLSDDKVSRDKFKSLIKISRDKYNSRVMDTSNLGGEGSYVITDTDRVKKAWNKMGLKSEDFNKKTQNALKRHKSLVFIDDTANNASLAHELGHLHNSVENKRLSKRSQDPEVRKKLTGTLNTSGIFDKIDRGKYKGKYKDNPVVNTIKQSGIYDTGVGVRESLRRLREGNAVIREENKASKKGLKLLKQLGSSKDELKASKQYLKDAGKTYKTGRLLSVLSPIQNKIQIESRRRK